MCPIFSVESEHQIHFDQVIIINTSTVIAVTSTGSRSYLFDPSPCPPPCQPPPSVGLDSLHYNSKFHELGKIDLQKFQQISWEKLCTLPVNEPFGIFVYQ